MTDDIVKALRELACISGHGELGDAADEIERLRAELAAERERVIEECAGVSESGMLPFSLGGDHILCPATAMTIAENIRALKRRRG